MKNDENLQDRLNNIKYLLTKKTNLTRKDENPDAEILKALQLQNFSAAEIDTPLESFMKYSLLQIAVRDLRWHVVKELLNITDPDHKTEYKLTKADPNFKNKNGDTCLHILLRSETDCNNEYKYEKKTGTNTPLRRLEVKNEILARRVILKLLLKTKGVDVNITTSFGETPLEIAIGKQLEFEADKLLEKGASVRRAYIQQAKNKYCSDDFIEKLEKAFEAQTHNATENTETPKNQEEKKSNSKQSLTQSEMRGRSKSISGSDNSPNKSKSIGRPKEEERKVKLNKSDEVVKTKASQVVGELIEKPEEKVVTTQNKAMSAAKLSTTKSESKNNLTTTKTPETRTRSKSFSKPPVTSNSQRTASAQSKTSPVTKPVMTKKDLNNLTEVEESNVRGRSRNISKPVGNNNPSSRSKSVERPKYKEVEIKATEKNIPNQNKTSSSVKPVVTKDESTDNLSTKETGIRLRSKSESKPINLLSIPSKQQEVGNATSESDKPNQNKTTPVKHTFPNPSSFLAAALPKFLRKDVAPDKPTTSRTPRK